MRLILGQVAQAIICSVLSPKSESRKFMHCMALHLHLPAALGAPALSKTSINQFNRIGRETLSTSRCALSWSPPSRRHALMGMYNGERSC